MNRASSASTASPRGHRHFVLQKPIFGAPILFALVFILNVTDTNAQVIGP